MHNCKVNYIIGTVATLAILTAASTHGFYASSVIDAHEHIQSLNKAEMLLEADDSLQIRKTILLATPTETLTLNGQKSFTGYRENMEELLKIAEVYPDRFFPFCTVNPLDSDALEYLQQCIENGGKGLKLFNGHSYYHAIFGIPLDSPRMLPIYAYAERNHIPVLYHVNITEHGDELESVLNQFPDLVVNVPHFMVSSIQLDKVTALLDKYPYLYTDISFGSPEFMAAGFRRINREPGKYANFINKYQDRILFGADMVLTNAKYKNAAYMEEKLTCYKDLLEERHFECHPVSEYYSETIQDRELSYENCEPKEGEYCASVKEKLDVQQGRLDEVQQLNGLGLSRPVLEKIYWKNANHFLNANQ